MLNSPLNAKPINAKPINAKPKDVYENLSCYTSFPCFNTTLFFLSSLTYFTVRKHCPFSSELVAEFILLCGKIVLTL